MSFQVLDKKTMKEVSLDDFTELARNNNLMEFDIEGFALQEDGETIGNAVAIVTPATIGDFFNVSLTTFVIIPCGCCVTVSVENTSDGTAIDVENANIIIDRIA